MMEIAGGCEERKEFIDSIGITHGGLAYAQQVRRWRIFHREATWAARAAFDITTKRGIQRSNGRRVHGAHAAVRVT